MAILAREQILQGETGENKGYATFKNPLYGGRAVSRLIDTYRNKYGINTIDSFIDRYAPAGDNTKEARAGYKKFLSDKTGLGIGEEFDLEKAVKKQTGDYPQLSAQDYSTVKKDNRGFYVTKRTD